MYGHSWRCDRCGHQPELSESPSFAAAGVDQRIVTPPAGWLVVVRNHDPLATSDGMWHLCPNCALDFERFRLEI